jgi:autotransporter-associated beta strand protein
MKPPSRLSFFLFFASSALLAISSAQAQTFTWDGGGGDANFGTALNWAGDTTPGVGSGVILQFTGGTNTSPINNYNNGDNFGEWWLLSGALSPFTITGSGFGLFNKIENSSSQLFTINTAGIYSRDGTMEINPVGGNITIGSSTAIELDGNATLNVFDGSNSRTLTINGTLSNGNGTGGNGALVTNQTATVILTGTNDYGGTVLNNSSKLRVGAAGTTGTLGVGNVTLNNTSSLIFDRSNAMTVTNLISGAGSVTKLGADTLTLTNANNFTGGLTINAGTVYSNSNSNTLGTGKLTIGDVANTGAAAELLYTGVSANTAFSNLIDVRGNGTATIRVAGYNPTFSGAINLGNNLTVISNNNFGSTIGISGGVTGTGNLVIQSNAANGGASSAITFSGSTVNMVGTITNNGTTTSTTASNTSISAVIGTNVTGITQNSTNSQLSLSGNNTFTGNITITTGTLNASLTQTVNNPTSGALGNPSTAGRQVTIASGAALNFNNIDVLGQGGTGNTALTLIANGGTIRHNVSGAGYNTIGPVQLNGGTLTSIATGSNGFKLTGTVTVGGSAVSTISASGVIGSSGVITYDVADAVAGSGSDLNVTAVVADIFGNGGIIKTGAGTMTLSNQNTFTGGTRIDNGTLTLSHATNTLLNTGAVNVNGGTLALGTNTDTVGAVTLTSGSITGSGTGAQGTLTGTGSNFDVRSGTVSAKLGGTIGLDKTTGGTVTLSGVNAYTGATTISAGKLIIDGSTHASSAVSVGASGTLGGTGTINGTLAVTGILAPGTANGDIQTLDAGTTTWNGGSVWNFDLATASTSSDQLAITGNFTKGTAGAYQFNFMGSNPNVSGRTYTLVTWTGTTTFSASNFTFTGLTGSFTGGTFGIVGNSLQFYSAIPEPTSALAGLLLTTGILRRRRR